MIAVLWILSAVVCVVAGQILLKIGMHRVGAIEREHLKAPVALAMSVARQPAVVAGIALYAVSALLWLYVLSRSALSFAYPFLSLAYAAVTAAATLLLKETFTWRQWAGLMLVIAGVVAVAASGM